MCLDAAIIDQLKLLKVGSFKDTLNLGVNKLVELLASVKLLKVIVCLLVVAFSELVILENGVKSIVKELLATLSLIMLIHVVASRLNGECTITDINTLFSECFFELGFKMLSNLWLRGCVLVDPETYLISELLVIEASG